MPALPLTQTKTPAAQTACGYDAAGTITQWKQWHSGLGAGVPARRHDLGYDLADQLIADEVHADDAGNALLKLHGYGYDAAGNRTGEQADGSVVTWTANAANQLTARAGGGSATVVGTVSAGATVKVNSQSVPVTGGQWRASVSVSAGTNTIPVQATETNPTPGTNAQVTNRTLTLSVPAANRTPGYDFNGSVTADGTGRTYEWDGANRLVTIIHAGGTKTRFSYDGMNRWVKLTEETAGGTVTGEKRFVWEGMTLAEERDAANAVTRRFFAEGEQIGGTPYLVFRDHLGSVREMTTLAGTVAARYDYDPYGRRTKLSGALEADFGYTGHYHHAPSNLTVAPFRFYDPEMRWLSRDPIEEEGGMNLYGYVSNDPVNGVDILGLAPGDWWDPRTPYHHRDAAMEYGDQMRLRAPNDSEHHSIAVRDFGQRMAKSYCGLVGALSAFAGALGGNVAELFHPSSDAVADTESNLRLFRVLNGWKRDAVGVLRGGRGWRCGSGRSCDSLGRWT